LTAGGTSHPARTATAASPTRTSSRGGRTHRAKPGEPDCPAEGCERPAGFATANPGEGPCLRHGGAAPATPRTRAAVPLARAPGAAGTPLERRLRGPGRPARDPLALLRVLLTCARRAGFRFEEAWDLAASTSLGYMSDRRAEECWDALARDRRAWAYAYQRSPRTTPA